MRRRPGQKIAQLAAILPLDPPPLPVAWTAPRTAPGPPPCCRRRARDRARPDGELAPKVWPAERFAAVFHALESGPLPGAVPVVFGGPGAEERAMAAPLLAALPGAIDLFGMLSLPEAAACLRVPRCSSATISA